MCDRLSELRDGLARYAAAFDAALLPAESAAQVVTEAATMERIAAALKSLGSARSADAGAWKAAGDRTAAHHLARTTGTSLGPATEALQTGRRLEALPAASAAARAGRLSAQQAAAIADAAVVDPASEQRLVESAQRRSLAELREECARTKAAAQPDPEARRRNIHAGRFLRSYTDVEGAWNLRVPDNPEVGVEVMAAIDAVRDRLFRAARGEGRREPSEAYAADALLDLARGSGSRRSRAGGRAKVIVRVDLAALLRGRPVRGELCELAGFGPIAVSAARELIETGDPFLAAVVTKGEQVTGVAHLGRRATAAQQTALEWLYPTCAVEGCSASTWLENDHRVDWATSHLTVFDLLDRLCPHHHDRKGLDGWALVPGHGKRSFVAPHDPRHPRHAHDPPSAA